MGAYIKTQSLPRVEDPLTQRALSIIEEELTRLANATAGTVLWGNGLQYVPGTRVASIDYNTTNFKITSGELNTIQDIDITAEVQFAKAKLIMANSADYEGLHPYTALLLENNDDIYIQLQGITTGHAGIAFADDDYNPPAGRIHYSFNDDVMDWGVATNVVMSLDADGLLTVVSLALNAHNADSYLAFKEDDSLKWTVGFDYDDDLKFKISEGIPGTNDVVEIQPGQGSLRFVRASVDKGLQYLDTGDSSRWMMRVASGTDVVEILNRAAHGKVEIHANTVTAGVDGDTLVATFEDDLITLAVDMSGTDLTLSNPVNIYALSHDSFAGFVADEHIDHSGVSISAGGILSGGGTIAANRTISLAHGDVDHDQLANTHNLTTDIDHDALTNYLVAEHVSLPSTIASVLSDHNKAAHTALGLAELGANSDITSMSGITGTITTPTNLATKTTGAWDKSIGAGGDYADWATMIAAMPDTIKHSSTITIKAATTLTEDCNIYNKHGIVEATLIITAEKYFPTSGVIPTADSATATTLRDAALAAAALGDDYFNGCWIKINHGTGTDNGYVLITDYVDATGDVVVAAWPGTQPDNTSRYLIFGALIDAGSESFGFNIRNNTIAIYLYGIGIKDSDDWGFYIQNNIYTSLNYCGAYNCDRDGIACLGNLTSYNYYCGVVNCNTDNNASSGGIYAGFSNSVYVYKCGISDNLQRGVLGETTTYIYASNNFGDLNGNWGIYVQNGAQANIVGVECSGAAGNHSDPGTAGNANADQAAAY